MFAAMRALRVIGAAVLAASFLAAAPTALAATYTFDLTGDVAGAVHFHGHSGPLSYRGVEVPLLNGGSSTIGGYTLDIGDTLQGTLSLSGALKTYAASNIVIVLIHLGDVGSDQLTSTGSPLQLTLGGSDINPFSPFVASEIGYVAPNTAGFGAIPSFSFDGATFNASVTNLQTFPVYSPLSSVDVARTSPYLIAVSFGNPQGVPEPAAWVTMIVGLAAIGGSVRLARSKGHAASAAA